MCQMKGWIDTITNISLFVLKIVGCHGNFNFYDVIG